MPNALPPTAANSRPGQANGNARLTEDDVRAIRHDAARVARGRAGRPYRKTGRGRLSHPLRGTGVFARWAKRCGVSVAAVTMAAYGDTWADVPGALPKPRKVARG